MEQTLPRDIMNEILSKLNNHELYQYGSCSKISYESAETIWQKRYHDILPRLYKIIESQNLEISLLKFQDNTTWCKKYTRIIKFVLSRSLNKLMDQAIIADKDIQHHNDMSLEMMLDIIHQMKDVMKQHLKIIKFLLAVEEKLSEFIMYGSFTRREIAHKYYPLIFPETYRERLQQLEEMEQ
jgi:hypothetical protein